MTTVGRQLRAWTWIALVAMLGLALAPTVSRAMSVAAPWEQVCSAAGHDGAAGGSSDTKPGHLDHCALCAASAVPMGLPPARSMSMRLDLAHFRPALFTRSARTLFAWTSPPSHGPPVSC